MRSFSLEAPQLMQVIRVAARTAKGKGNLLKTDQRGLPRPNTEDIEDKKGCDMGAFEKQSD